MGYTSRMDGDYFSSDLTLDELNARYAEYVKEYLPRQIMCYEFEMPEDMDNKHPKEEWAYAPEGMCDSYCKNYDTDELAIFISMVCKDTMELSYVSEGGCKWGYKISPGLVLTEEVIHEKVMFKNSHPDDMMKGLREHIQCVEGQSNDIRTKADEILAEEAFEKGEHDG